MSSSAQKAIALAGKQGVIRARDLKRLGVSHGSLRHLVSRRVLERTRRGLYLLTGFEITRHHTMVEAVQRQSKAVVCLLSALSFHEIGTQLPHKIWLAVPRGTRQAKPNGVPMHTVVLSSPGYENGIEKHLIEGVEVQVYNLAKTVADCFKFRNTVGLDVALEALREAIRSKKCSRSDIMKYAKINRVDKVMRPYMEAMSV